MADPKKKPTTAVGRIVAPEPEPPPPEPTTAVGRIVLPEPEEPNRVMQALSYVPSMVMGLGHAFTGKGTADSRQLQSTLLNQANESNAQENSRYAAQVRANARNAQEQTEKAAAARRQARLDAEKRASDALNMDAKRLEIKRGQRTEAEAEERRNPNAPKNVLLKRSLAETHPEFWNRLTPEQQANVTVDNVEGLALSLKDAERQQRLVDDKDKIKYQQQMEKEYDTTKAPVTNVYAPASPIDLNKARALFEQAWGGKPPPAATARFENIANAPVPRQSEMFDELLKESPGGKVDPRSDKADADAPPEGFQVDNTPGSKAAYARGLQDASARKRVEAVTSIMPDLENTVDRMIELRTRSGVEPLPSSDKAEYDNLHASAIGFLNRAVLDAGVLNEGERKLWEAKLGTMGPSVKDVLPGDYLVKELEGLKTMIAAKARNAYAAFGLKKTGSTLGERQRAEEMAKRDPKSKAAQAQRMVRVKNPKTGETHALSPEKAKIAVERGWVTE